MIKGTGYVWEGPGASSFGYLEGLVLIKEWEHLIAEGYRLGINSHPHLTSPGEFKSLWQTIYEDLCTEVDEPSLITSFMRSKYSQDIDFLKEKLRPFILQDSSPVVLSLCYATSEEEAKIIFMGMDNRLEERDFDDNVSIWEANFPIYSPSESLNKFIDREENT